MTPTPAHNGPLYGKWDGKRLLLGLRVDYMGASPLGAWVQGEGEVLKTTRNMLFGQGLVTADGQPVLRVSGIFKMGQMIGDGKATEPLALK